MTRSSGAAALAGVGTFALVVAALHLLQRDYEPAHQLMSELALGRHGWSMIVAFAGLAVATFAIQHAIGALGASMVLRILLVAAAAFFLVAGIFPQALPWASCSAFRYCRWAWANGWRRSSWWRG
jgi:uncharacterized protein DUF998